MKEGKSLFNIICDIEDYGLKNEDAIFTLSFAEGDSYKCIWNNGEYVDNEEEIGSPGYEEWYELVFHVEEILNPGPNKDPRFEFITISEKHMPSSILCDGKVLYQAD
jgi:hypothetical protein